MTITKDAVARIHRTLGKHLGEGGFYVFDENGRNGWWHTDDTYEKENDPSYDTEMFDGQILVAVPYYASQLSTVEQLQNEIQAWLDARDQDRERDEINRQAGY